MIAPIVKTILAGILGGILLFAIPFLLFKAFFFFLFIGLIFRLAGRRRFRGHYAYYDHYEIPFQGKENLRDYVHEAPKSI